MVSGVGAEASATGLAQLRSVGTGRVQLAAALMVIAIFAIIAAVVLSRDHTRLAGTNGVANLQWVVKLEPGQKACQTPVLLPQESAGARVFVGTYGRRGPRLLVTVATPSGEIVRRGSLSGGYRDARWQVIRFRRVATSTGSDTLCISSTGSRIALAGTGDPNADNRSLLIVGGKQQGADLSLQLVRPGQESLFALVPTIFHRAALFRPSWVGAWTYYMLFGLLVLTIGLAITALIWLGNGRIGVGGAAVVVVGVAFLNAAIWSLVMPAFNPPDEASHFAYVASLVDLGRRPYTNPSLPGGSFSAREELAIEYTALGIVQQRQAKPPWTRALFDEWSSVNKTVQQARPYQIGGGYDTAASYSPFYYGLEAAPYVAGKSMNIFGQLWLMRLLSALLAAATAGCAFLFAREMLPTVGWAGLVAGLAVAFQPMFAQLGGAVNNDNLLILCGTLELYLLARILREGLTLTNTVAAGGVLGAGILAKPTMYALLPVAVGVVIFVLFRDRARGIRYASLVAGAGALGALVVLNYFAFSGASDVSTLGQTGGPSHGFQIREFLSYVWQWYLPRLPFMHDFATGIPAYDIYFKGFFAAFGHLETTFPSWVYALLAAVSVLLLVLVVIAIYQARAKAWLVLPRVALGVAAVAGVALLVNVRSYLALIQASQPFAQGRYLLLAIGVFGVAVATASKAFGVRRGIVVGTALVVGIAGLNAFSLGLVLLRYYT